MDTIVIWTGLLSGVALIAATVYVYVTKHDIPLRGLVLAAIGAVLIGMSVWSDITFSAGDANFRLIKELGVETRNLAEQVERVASDADVARTELAASVGELSEVVSRLDVASDDPAIAAGLLRVGQHTAATRAIASQVDAVASIDRRLLDFVDRDAPTVRWDLVPRRD